MTSPQTAPAGRGHRAPAGEGERLRDQLLDAAEARMMEAGFQGMSLRQVARDVGVSATSVYLHFSSKEDLAVATCQRRFAHLADLLAEARVGIDDPLEQISAAGRAYIEYGLANPELYGFLFGGGISMEEAAEHLGPTEELAGVRCLRDMITVVAAGMEQGAVRPGDPDEVAYALWAVVHGVVGVVTHSGAKVGGPEVESLIETTMRMVLVGLGAERTVPAGSGDTGR